MNELIKQYRKLVDEKQELDNLLTLKKKEIEEVDRALVEAMERAEIQNITVAGVGQVYLEHVVSPNIDDAEACEAWLREKDDFDMLLSFNTNKFKAYYKALIKNNEPLPEGVSQYTATKTKLRRL